MAAVMAGAALAAGCGGDDSDAEGADTTVTTSSLSKAQFVKKAEALCLQEEKRLYARLKAYGNKNPAEGGVSEGPEAVRKILLPPIQRQIDELRELGAPRGEEKQLETYLDALQEAVDTIDEKGLSSSDELGRAYKRPNELVRKYGLKECVF